MARARNIKPGFYKNEDLAECSVWARYIFPGLWMLADREGRLEDRPKRIKGELIPFDAQDVEPLLRELEGRGFIKRYKNSDGSFIQIAKFKEHQSPHYSEKQSVIKPYGFREITGDIDQHFSENPPPIKRGLQRPDSLNPDSPTSDSLNPEPLKKEKAPPRGSRLLLDALPDEWKNFCLAERVDLDPERVFADFSDYWKAKPGKDAVKLDWLATWRKWVRNSREGKGPAKSLVQLLDERDRRAAN